MASSGWARTRKPALLLGLAACGACTTTTLPPEPAAAPAFEAGVALPEGPGREILVAACLSCHELAALALFKGFYTRESWRALVLTMQEHGAPVDDTEIEVLADYLAQHFGPATP